MIAHDSKSIFFITFLFTSSRVTRLIWTLMLHYPTLKAAHFWFFGAAIREWKFIFSPVPVTPKGPDDNARALSEKQSEWHNMAQLITLTLTENALNKEPNKPTPSHTEYRTPYAICHMLYTISHRRGSGHKNRMRAGADLMNTRIRVPGVREKRNQRTRVTRLGSGCCRSQLI